LLVFLDPKQRCFNLTIKRTVAELVFSAEDRFRDRRERDSSRRLYGAGERHLHGEGGRVPRTHALVPIKQRNRRLYMGGL